MRHEVDLASVFSSGCEELLNLALAAWHTKSKDVRVALSWALSKPSSMSIMRSSRRLKRRRKKSDGDDRIKTALSC